MNPTEKIAEEKIREAMEKGEFDNLPGKGKPIDLSDYFKTPPHLRLAYSILKNAGVLPNEVQLKKEIELLKVRRKNTADAGEFARLTKQINEKNAQLNISLERYRPMR